MKYVKGYQLRTVGPFTAKEWFEGVVDKIRYVESEQVYVIQGISLPATQIVSVIDTLATRETLKLKRGKVKVVDNKVQVDRFTRQAKFLRKGLVFGIERAKKKQHVPYIDLAEIDVRVAQLRKQVVATSGDDDTRHHKLYTELKEIYADQFKIIKDAPLKYPF